MLIMSRMKIEKRGINNEIGKKNEKVQNFRHEEIPEFRRTLANRAALYHGILRDHFNRLECLFFFSCNGKIPELRVPSQSRVLLS